MDRDMGFSSETVVAARSRAVLAGGQGSMGGWAEAGPGGNPLQLHPSIDLDMNGGG
jgi:hypothetical protein